MSLKVIKSDENNLTFLIKDLDLSFINSIRRVLMSDIDGYAFDEIEIKENTSIIHNEQMRHRIGLIPIRMGTQMTFGCSVTNNKEQDMYVMSDDLVAMDDNIEFDIMKGIPVAILRKDETLDFVAKTGQGHGSDNIKYSVISDVNFIKMKRLSKNDIVEELSEYMFKDLYYGRKYLLEKNKIKYDTTKMYCMKINTIMMDPKLVLKIGLLKLRRKLVLMREKMIKDISIDKYYSNFIIDEIDYECAQIFTYMLMRREEIKIATYTRKHFLDNFIEFKVERKKDILINKSEMEMKEEEMDKAIKIVDSLTKMSEI